MLKVVGRSCAGQRRARTYRSIALALVAAALTYGCSHAPQQKDAGARPISPASPWAAPTSTVQWNEYASELIAANKVGQFPALRTLAALRRLRGRWFDPFGHSEERRLERRLARDYEAMIDDVLATLDAQRHARALAIARVPEGIRGYGPVKLANVAAARKRWHDLR